MNPSTACARTLVDELVRCGVREAVVAPGSRSAPLAMALHDADAQGRLRLHVRVDERSAGFLALGLAKGSRRPVPVVTTSGTAVANLHPAVLEASHAGVPLLVLSADRPAALRGTGANQTTDQAGLFGTAVRLSVDWPATSGDGRDLRALVCRAWATGTGVRTRLPGPVQLNLQLDDPLVPGEGHDPLRWPQGRPGGAPWTVVEPDPTGEPVPLRQGPRTVVLAGDGAGPQARQAAERGGWPLLAEPSSGSRTGAFPIAAYRLLLDADHLGGAIERVVVAETRPDLTLVLDAPASLGLARAAARRGGDDGADRFEAEGRGFHERLRQAFLDIAEQERDRCVVVDASTNPDVVEAAIWGIVESRLLGGRRPATASRRALHGV